MGRDVEENERNGEKIAHKHRSYRREIAPQIPQLNHISLGKYTILCHDKLTGCDTTKIVYGLPQNKKIVHE